MELGLALAIAGVAFVSILAGIGSGSPAQGPSTSAGRTDNVVFYGGGVGYRLGPDTRLGFNVDYYTRRSDVSIRQYEGLRVGSSVTYGF